MSSDMASEFIGSWRLVSFSDDRKRRDHLPDGPRDPGTYHLRGQRAHGRATGGRERHRIRAGRSACAATDAEVRAAFDGYLAYYGTYTVHVDQRTVVHHLEMCSIPNWRGSEQVRHCDLQDGQLNTLSTPPILFGGAERVSKLVWVKLPSTRA